MTEIFWLQDARTILATRNALEAEDIAFTLGEVDLQPVLVVRSTRVLRQLVSEADPAPKFVVIGLAVPADEKWALIAQCRAAGSRVLVIDGEAQRQEPGILGVLNRPFTSDQLHAVLRELNLIPA